MCVSYKRTYVRKYSKINLTHVINLYFDIEHMYAYLYNIKILIIQVESFVGIVMWLVTYTYQTYTICLK